MKPIKQIPTDFFSLKKSLFWNATLQSVPNPHNPSNPCSLYQHKRASWNSPLQFSTPNLQLPTYLFHQHHFLCLNKIACLQSVEIHAA
jgi:hypothetical protein